MSFARVAQLSGIFFLTAYVIIGLAVSALLGISKFAFVSASIGVAIAVVGSSRFPRMYLNYILVYAFFLSTWLWGSQQHWAPLGTYSTAALGGLLVALALRRGWVNPETLVVILIIPTVVNLYAYLAGINYTTILYDIDMDAGFKRFSGFIGHPNTFVMRGTLPIVVVTFFVLTGLQSTANSVWRVLVSFSVAAAVFSAYASGSKKSLLLLALCLVFLALAGILKTRGGLRVLYALLIATALAVVITNLTSMALGSDPASALGRFQQMMTGYDESTADRTDLISIGWRLFQEKPLFGNGLDEFANLSGKGYYSHNNLIEALVSGGLVGALVYYSLIVGILFATYKRTRGSLAVVFASLVLIVYDATGITASDRAAQIFIGILMATASGYLANENFGRARGGFNGVGSGARARV